MVLFNTLKSRDCEKWVLLSYNPASLIGLNCAVVFKSAQ